MINRPAGLLAPFIILWALSASAEEGFWAFPDLPVEDIRRVTGVAVDDKWLEQVRLATVRVNDSGSGSFVSRSGLILTNHHVISDVLDTLSTKNRDLLKAGYRAKTQAEELKVPIEVLSPASMEDVTARVAAALSRSSEPARMVAARDAEIEAIVAESLAATGLKSEVSRHNDRFWLYRYREYEDVRLVMAPSYNAAYFGRGSAESGDPGHWLDMAILRVYGDDGKPLATPHFFPFDLKGLQDGDAVFASGFPYKTSRHLAPDQLEFEKRVNLPAMTQRNQALKQAYDAYAALGAEQRRAVLLPRSDYSEGAEDSGLGERLDEPEFKAAKQREQAELQRAIDASPALTREFGGLYADIEATSREKARRHGEWQNRALPSESKLATLALELVRYARETAKPEGERNPRYADSALPDLRETLARKEKILPDLEKNILAATLALSEKVLGPNDAFVADALDGATPAALAERAVKKTRLADPQFRKRLIAQGSAAILRSTDPLIQLAVRADPHIQEMKSWYAEKVQAAEQAQTWLMARLKTAVTGLASPPDADWGPRLSYGNVRGYEDQGRSFPHSSRYSGMFELADRFPKDPDFALDPLLRKNRAKVSGSTAVNNLSTLDIAGGNSGSALFNSSRRFVGLVYGLNGFGNADDYRYSPEKGRTLTVDASGILEALRKGFGMGRIAEEITQDAMGHLARRGSSDGVPQRAPPL